ncbi:hypothetical protein ES319_D08G046400v1 [Gossypium barbadense]|uniref:Uncharacterized protein n=2 Tax=Gossypium TaxID=3633 RepID=A0A5J5QBR8_GOSBA|nr:hypothetical protein ES319_D08G046400v1 [Gossypium barbadense]TYG56277.1 hypothetical protein ES288_D08G051300v1 [Gossypium darwinii]
MKDTPVLVFIQEVPTTIIFQRRIIIPLLLLLVSGLNQGGEVMRKNIPVMRILGIIRTFMCIHIGTWIHIVIMRSLFKILISFGMAIVVLTTSVIMNLAGPLGMGGKIGKTTHMIIMIIGLTFPIRAGTTAVRGIMNIVEIVMILIIKEAVAEMVVGGSVNHVIEILSVEKEIRVHIKGMRGLGLVPVDEMIVQDQGHLEFGAMGEAIERTDMMIIKMRKLRSKGTEKRNISWSNILWHHLQLLL